MYEDSVICRESYTSCEFLDLYTVNLYEKALLRTWKTFVKLHKNIYHVYDLLYIDVSDLLVLLSFAS